MPEKNFGSVDVSNAGEYPLVHQQPTYRCAAALHSLPGRRGIGLLDGIGANLGYRRLLRIFV